MMRRYRPFVSFLFGRIALFAKTANAYPGRRLGENEVISFRGWGEAVPFSIVRNDIARMKTDVIVNAANERLVEGGGVCGAVFAAAGPRKLQAACKEVAPCPTGSAVPTPGFDAPARWIVHAVGPRYVDGEHGEETLLRGAYRSALAESARLGARSVSMPLISAGIFGYPPTEALHVACDEIRAFLATEKAQVDGHEMTVYLVVFDRAAFAASLGLVDEVRSFIDEKYVRSRPRRGRQADLEASAPVTGLGSAEDFEAGTCLAANLCVFESMAEPDSASASASTPVPTSAPIDRGEISELLSGLDVSFSQALLALIDASGLTDAQVYHRANLSRQLFAKIRRDNGYRPTKQTAVALAVALELDFSQTQELLAHAGLTLSASSKFDVIVTYFIERGRYDIFELNAMLFAFDQPLLGSL